MSGPRLLCCGEALIDMIATPAPDGPVFRPVPGGGMFNTAIAAARLGLPTGLIAGLSTDLFGAELVAAATASGVDISLCPRAPRPTTLAFVALANGQPAYAFHDENTAGRMLRSADLPALPDSVQALAFGGISLAGEPCGTTYEALCARESARLIVLDPNIRPAIVTDAPALRARLHRMIARADIVKLSDEDLDWLAPGAEPAALTAQGLMIVTRGARGALAFRGAERIAVPAPAVAVVDTVGAGDTFTAGVLAGLDRAGALSKAGLAAASADTIRAALILGSAAAAITVTRAGANPPWAKELP